MVLPELEATGCHNDNALTEKFNQCFCNIGKELAETLEEPITNQLPEFLSNTFSYQDITCEEITSMIKTMPWDKTPGYDDISVNISKGNIVLAYRWKRYTIKRLTVVPIRNY
ncbi:unnamed protein product [Ixodes persulcatus]